MLKQDYLRNGAAIYERSFAIIRAEADLSRFTPEEAEVAVRMIHAAGQVEVAGLIEFAPEFVSAARKALRGGAPILKPGWPSSCIPGSRAWTTPRPGMHH